MIEDIQDLTEAELAAVTNGIQTIPEAEEVQMHINSQKTPGDATADEIATRWLPDLSPKQFEVFFDTSPNLLLESMRFTGKSWAVGYAAVKHAFDWPNALVLIVAKTKRQLMTGGLMSKLGAEILPDFEKNLEDFEWVGPKLTVEKDVIYTVTNRYGGRGIIQMMSIGNDSDLERKMKGIEASLCVCDEVTLYESSKIFEYLSATLGRRNHIPPEQQRFVGTCNPGQPDHWVADTWSVLDPEKRDAAFRVISLKPEDNPSPQTKAYYERLRQTLKNNPTQAARDIEGLWVALPEGDAIFKDSFVPGFHVKGNVSSGELLRPVKGFPITVGWDAGDGNHAVIFAQEVPTKEKILWVVLDEIVYIKQTVSLDRLTREAMQKMNAMCEAADFNFSFDHVSDNSAFNRFRASAGSYDWKVVEECSQKLLKEFPRIKKPIRLIECPKPEGSVGAGCRMLIELFQQNALFISANCKNMIETFTKITGKKDDPFAPGTRDRLKHALDAIRYPLFQRRLGGNVSAASALTPQVISLRS